MQTTDTFNVAFNIAEALAPGALQSERSSEVVEVSHLYNFKSHPSGVNESLASPALLLLVKLNLLIRTH